MSNLRVWNWIPKSETDIIDYFQAVNPDYSEINIYFKEVNVCCRAILDDENLINLTKAKYSDRVNKVEVENARRVTLYFLSNSLPVNHERIVTENKLLSKDKARTDVLFDPINNVALIHGPSKFGFINSMLVGQMSFLFIQEGKYGLHSGLTTVGEVGYIFCGAHGMGKTSLAITHLLLDDFAKIVSDDWVYYSIDSQNSISVLSLDSELFVGVDTVSHIVESVPENIIVNHSLYKELERYIKNVHPQELLKTDSRALGVIKHLDEICHRILSNFRYSKICWQYSTSHFKPPVIPIIREH